MPRSENQKLKLLYLYKILNEKTDEEHPISVSQIIAELARLDISAERKSVYSDIQALQQFGLDILCRKSKTYGYYVASKNFELPELKLLADAVASSKFITEKKSHELIKKIEGMASIHQAKQIQRQVYVQGRVKTANEKIYYNVDAIHQAIAQNRQITFKYFEYNIHKEKHYRNNGENYVASPYALSWDDENYYMIAYYPKHEGLSHFRVDKMESVEGTDKRRVEIPDAKSFDLAEYLKKTYNMFGGKEEKIRLQFDNSLIGVVLDRFGMDTPIRPIDENSFCINVEARISPTFLGWLFTFGNKVKVLSPQSLIDRFIAQGRESLEQYKQWELK